MSSKSEKMDRFMKQGRLGPAILASYNLGKKKPLQLEDLTFDLRRGPEGRLEIVVKLPNDHDMVKPVHTLYTCLPGARDITPEEQAFFKSLGV